MKKFILISLLIAGAHFTNGQSIDEARMERDLEVARRVLSTLYGQGGERYIWGTRTDASYVPGYGVIINVPEDVLFLSGYHMVPPKAPKIAKRSIRSSGDEAEARELEEIAKKNKKIAKENEKIAKENEKIARENELLIIGTRDYHDEVEGPDTEEIVRTFFADYADLIGQLKPEDRIMIKQKSSHDEFYFNWSSDDEVDVLVDEGRPRGLTAEAVKKDITAYRLGKISREELDSRIKITKAKPQEKVADLEMFGNMIKSFYSAGLSKTFFTEGKPSYEVLEGYGAIFQMKTYSSYQDGDMYVMPVKGKTKVNDDERKQTIEELYPQFEKEFREFIVDYGRTIRSLADDDLLMMKVKLTRCKGCSIPKNIDVSVKMKVLKDYDQQKIKRDKALASIQVKRYEQ